MDLQRGMPLAEMAAAASPPAVVVGVVQPEGRLSITVLVRTGDASTAHIRRRVLRHLIAGRVGVWRVTAGPGPVVASVLRPRAVPGRPT